MYLMYFVECIPLDCVSLAEGAIEIQYYEMCIFFQVCNYGML